MNLAPRCWSVLAPCSARLRWMMWWPLAPAVLSPNCHLPVIAQTLHHGVLSMPGVATPSEAFAALAAGAQALKLFPADVLGPASFKGWRAVLPTGTPMFGVGGIGVDNLASFRRASASGVGLGSSLYVPGISLPELAQRARQMLAAWQAAARRQYLR